MINGDIRDKMHGQKPAVCWSELLPSLQWHRESPCCQVAGAGYCRPCNGAANPHAGQVAGAGYCRPCMEPRMPMLPGCRSGLLPSLHGTANPHAARLQERAIAVPAWNHECPCWPGHPIGLPCPSARRPRGRRLGQQSSMPRPNPPASAQSRLP